MAKVKTFFEQVPVAIALQLVEQDSSERSAPALCSICGTPVELENCKVNESGQAVHGKCYVSRIARRSLAKVPRSTNVSPLKRASR